MTTPSSPAEQIAHLPPVVRRYLRFMGVVGQPRVWSFRVRFQGRFRLRRGLGWMPAEAWQYNSAVQIGRMFVMRIRFAGVTRCPAGTPISAGTVGWSASYSVTFTVVDDEGPEFDIGEPTTYLNDAIMLAPSMLLTPSTTWTEVDGQQLRCHPRRRGSQRHRSRLLDDTGAPSTSRPPTVTPRCRQAWYAPNGERRCRTGNRSTGGWFPARSSAVWRLPGGDLPYIKGRFMSNSLQLNISPWP